MILNKYTLSGYVHALEYVIDFLEQKDPKDDEAISLKFELIKHFTDVSFNYEELFNTLKDKSQSDDSFALLKDKK